MGSINAYLWQILVWKFYIVLLVLSLFVSMAKFGVLRDLGAWGCFGNTHDIINVYTCVQFRIVDEQCLI